jgi:hypothetical protein
LWIDINPIPGLTDEATILFARKAVATFLMRT